MSVSFHSPAPDTTTADDTCPRQASFDLAIESALWHPPARWRALVARALDACAADAGRDWPGRPVSVLLCDDLAMRGHNKAWRGVDASTNVLSFPAGGPPHPDATLGDVAIAFETADREARTEGKTLPDHVAHLVVHGTLHLLGHDHETAPEAEAMEARERRVLARMQVADPYAATEPLAEAPPR